MTNVKLKNMCLKCQKDHKKNERIDRKRSVFCKLCKKYIRVAEQRYFFKIKREPFVLKF